MGLRMKNYEGSPKNPVFRKRFIKSQYIGGIAQKEGLRQFVDLRGTWLKKGVGVFKGGLIPQCTLKVGSLLHKTCIKVLKLDMCTSVISLSKIAHKMLCNHPFSKRNKTTK